MKEGPSVLVVSCPSPFFDRGEGFSVTQDGIQRYLEHLDDNFESIEFFSEKGYGSSSSSCLLDIDSERLYTQSTDNPLHFLYDVAKNSIKILRRRREQEVISLVYIPSMFSFLLSPILVYKSDKIVLYYMSDTIKVLREGDSMTEKFKNSLYSFFDRFLLSNADAVLYRDKSVSERSTHGDQQFIRSKPIMALDIEEPFVKEDTCGSEPITILYVGSLIDRKGVNDLIKAFKKVQTHHYNTEYKLRVVGSGAKKAELVNLCEDLGVRQDVEFTGHISEEDTLLREFRTSDLFVLPSLEEGFPRVIIEAMSQSLPVVTTPVGEIPHRLSDGEAIQVDVESSDQIAHAIGEITENENIRKKLIRNGRRKAEEILDETAAEQHILVIEEV